MEVSIKIRLPELIDDLNLCAFSVQIVKRKLLALNALAVNATSNRNIASITILTSLKVIELNVTFWNATNALLPAQQSFEWRWRHGTCEDMGLASPPSSAQPTSCGSRSTLLDQPPRPLPLPISS